MEPLADATAMSGALSAAGDGISLVIPTHNRADLIAQTIESALGQTRAFAEIIVVDDGSTDATLDVLRRYGACIRVIRTANRGVQAARNTGVAAASTKLVALSDSDDLLEADYVATTGTWMALHPDIDILYCNFVTFDQQGVHADKFSLAPGGFFEGCREDGDFLSDIPDLYLRSLKYQPFFATGPVFRKAFFLRSGGYDVAFRGVGAEDWEFTLRAIASGRVAACRRPLTRIRKHGGNDSGNLIRMLLGESRILEFAIENHPGAEPHRELILRDVDRRRLEAFDAAFAQGDLDDAHAILRLLRLPLAARHRIKRAIVCLPGLPRRALWRLSQFGRK